MNWLWIASAGAFGAVACLVALAARLLATPAGAPPSPHRRPARQPALWRIGAPWVRLFAAPAQRLLPAGRRRTLDSTLRMAGLDAALSAGEFVAGQLLGAAGLGLLAWAVSWLLAALGAPDAAGVVSPGADAPGSALRSAGLVAAAMALGGALPGLWLRDRVRERRRLLLRQLPSLLDLLTVGLEAGCSASSALSLACDRLPAGPLQTELDRVLRDVRAGRGSAEALQAMAARLRIPAVAHMVSALVVGTRQGSNLGALLRAQAAQRRQERFVRAERAALQAPVKLLLPLAVCIFPGTFAILFFPVAVRLLGEGVL